MLALLLFFVVGGSATVAQDIEMPAILKRLPSELPRDTDGRWKDYGDWRKRRRERKRQRAA